MPSPSAVRATWIARSAPIARAVRRASADFAGPAEKAQMSAMEAGEVFLVCLSRRRTASSMAISSNGLSDCLRPEMSIAEALTRGLIW